MPRYDYQCTVCNHLFELRQGFDAETVTECPKCGKIAERKISLVPVIFKGSGWYATDSRSESEKAKFSDDGKEKPKKPEKTEKTGEPVASKASKSSNGASGSDGAASSSAGESSKDTGTTSGAD